MVAHLQILEHSIILHQITNFLKCYLSIVEFIEVVAFIKAIGLWK